MGFLNSSQSLVGLIIIILPIFSHLVIGGDSSYQPAPALTYPLSTTQLIAELSNPPLTVDIDKRVPLSTNDETAIPLISAQIHQPAVVPLGSSSCTIELLRNDFGNSFGTPAVASYTPPAMKACGEVGNWAAISGNITVYSIGTQYDRLSSLYLSNVEIWRHSSAEPTKTGTVWTTFKDLTPYTALFAKPGTVLMDLGNIISSDLGLDGVLQVTVSITFHTATRQFPAPKTANTIIPLSTLSSTSANYFTIDESGLGGTSIVTLPSNTKEAYIELYASGNSAEEFWYTNTPDAFIDTFGPGAELLGKGPFREVQVLVDGKLAGVAWPFVVIYTGGITPSNWRPLTSYGAYNQPTYHVDVTPFLPLLLDSSQHNITLTVVGQGSQNSINSNWFVSGNLQLSVAKTPLRKGQMITYSANPFADVSTKGSTTANNESVTTGVTASRHLLVESMVDLGDGSGRLKKVRFEQSLKYRNLATVTAGSWVQWASQQTSGLTQSSHDGVVALKDQFSYPIDVFSNYTLFPVQFGGYGSAINNTFDRTLQPPPIFAGGVAQTIHLFERSEGTVGMDDAPGLRHAINGTGETFAEFAYSDASKQSYFRKSHTKNDAWVSDQVWGTLQDGNPAVPRSQIFPGGGKGFKREVVERNAILSRAF